MGSIELNIKSPSSLPEEDIIREEPELANDEQNSPPSDSLDRCTQEKEERVCDET